MSEKRPEPISNGIITELVKTLLGSTRTKRAKDLILLMSVLIGFGTQWGYTQARLDAVEHELGRLNGQMQWFIGEAVRDGRWETPPETWSLPPKTDDVP